MQHVILTITKGLNLVPTIKPNLKLTKHRSQVKVRNKLNSSFQLLRPELSEYISTNFTFRNLNIMTPTGYKQL